MWLKETSTRLQRGQGGSSDPNHVSLGVFLWFRCGASNFNVLGSYLTRVSTRFDVFLRMEQNE